MVRTYVKGSRAERELIDFFSSKECSVIRAAGSGVNSLSPDLLVFRRGMQLAIEAKAWEKENLNINREQFENLKKWELNTGINCYVGWRRSREPWYFIPLSVFKENTKSFAVNWKQAQVIGKKVEEFF
jgi:Holliday junction resolvase